MPGCCCDGGRIGYGGKVMAIGVLRRLREKCGQMTVELCVVFPVVIIIAVIATNALSFFGTCAEFDRVVRNAVRTYAASPAQGESSDQSLAYVKASIQGSIDASNMECDVAVEKDHRGYECYTATLYYLPTLFGLGLKSEVFGVQMPRLTHTSCLSVDPYKPGMLI